MSGFIFSLIGNQKNAYKTPLHFSLAPPSINWTLDSSVDSELILSHRRHLSREMFSQRVGRRCYRFSSSSSRIITNKEEGGGGEGVLIIMTTMMNRLVSKVNFFNDGVKQLKSDFFNSLHIQEAELSRLFLQRKIRLQYEQHRRKLRSHYPHGIHVVIQEGGGGASKEVAFIPSNVYSQHHAAAASAAANNNSSKMKHNISFPEQNFYASSNYLSTRRPQEHIRQISRDLQVTLPTVAAFVLVPMVGSAFMFLGLMFPRLLLSRQFHTKQQRWHFATKEFGERRGYFERLSDDFWGSCMRVMPRLTLCCTADDKNGTMMPLPQVLEPMRYHEMDAGGPVLTKLSINILYRLQQLPSSSSGEDNNTLPSISSLQNTHIHSLSLANSLAAPLLLPSSLSPIFLQTCLPIRYLQYKLVTLAEDIIADDVALIEEGQIDIQCSGMREDEVLDACWLRGLPVGRFVHGVEERHSKDDELHIMRKELTNHLQMMKYAHMMVENDTSMCSRSELVRDKTLQLL